MRADVILNKMKCVRLLMKRGAVYHADSLGLTPVCYAGLGRMDTELLSSFVQDSRDLALGAD